LADGDGQIIQLITDFKESLEREIHASEKRVIARIDQMEARFEVISARLDRHAALLQAGSRWIARMNDWSEKVDQPLDRLTKRTETIERREKPPEGTQS